MKFIKILHTALVIWLINLSGYSQPESSSFVISGYVSDGATGEVLPGATIINSATGKGTTSNSYGFYSLRLPAGEHTIISAFIGYEPLQTIVNLKNDLRISLTLKPQSQTISEIEIKGLSREEQRRNPQMGVEKIDASTIRRVPVLFGETDPLKAIQLLPGISPPSEGSSGFSVRGGSPDQNLIVFDEAIVYNAGHLLGFFSVFNNDAIKEVQVFKGDLPASSGGRLSSLVDIRSRDGNINNLSGVAGIGLISSRLTLDGPIVKDKSSFLISGRRTYLDMFLPLSPDEDIRNNRLYFYDLNMKINYIAGENDRIFLSTYLGRDILRNQEAGMDFGNRTITLRWNRVFSPILFSNLTLVNSKYDYYLGTRGEGFQNVDWNSELNDYSLKYGFSWFPVAGEQVDFGLQTIFHTIRPGNISSIEDDTATFREINIPTSSSLEHGLYASHILNTDHGWTIRYGLRYSLFQNIGKARSFQFDSDYNITDTINYRRGKIFNSYGGLEPRIGVSKLINQRLSAKGSYANTRQYMHLASNSTSSTPLDVWFTSSPNILPQVSNQVSLGLFYKSIDNIWDHSLELYYKRVKNTIDFKDHPTLLLNEAIEGEVRPGKASARGLEWITRYSDSKLNGWISYTLSKSLLQSEWINDGIKYLSPYDHTHDFSVVVNYAFNNRINLSGSWVYFTGTPVTLPVGRFDFQGGIIPIYSRRNAERMPDYHRMDLSINIQGKNPDSRRYKGEWNVSVYNLYGRKNAWMINFIGDDYADPYLKTAEKTYLFSIVPSVSYMIRF